MIKMQDLLKESYEDKIQSAYDKIMNGNLCQAGDYQIYYRNRLEKIEISDKLGKTIRMKPEEFKTNKLVNRIFLTTFDHAIKFEKF